jgi:hypothetical protein
MLLIFIKVNDVLKYFLVLEVEMHLFEVKFIDLADWFFIVNANLQEPIVKVDHVFVSEEVKEF